MSNIPSRYVVQKAGMPRGPMINRPSIEYTGRGDQLVCFAWNGRFFRSNWDDVKAQCNYVVELVNGDPANGNDGEYISVGDLEAFWGIMVDDVGIYRGWAPSDDYPYPVFIFEVQGVGSYLYDRFGEEVLLVSIPEEARPYEEYLEV